MFIYLVMMYQIHILHSIKLLYNWWIHKTGEKGAVNYYNLLLQHLPGGNKNHKQCKLKLSFLLAKIQMCDLQIMKCIWQPPQHKSHNKYCHKLQWEGERRGGKEKEKRERNKKKEKRNKEKELWVHKTDSSVISKKTNVKF